MQRHLLFSLALFSAGLLTACPDEEQPGSRDASSFPPDATAVADAAPTPDAAPAPDAEPADLGDLRDAGISPDGGDASIADTGAPTSCVDEGREIGERYLVDDNCNFCECLASGATTCTLRRSCTVSGAPCTYDNTPHAYGEHFPSTDGCNECVCAASGLACTRRACSAGNEEGAILLETMTATCGADASFTPEAVLAEMPYTLIDAPFLYDRARPSYPETLPDSTIEVRVVYDGGFLACRIPGPGQEALDIEVIMEWRTLDGAFNEGFRAALSKNAGGFVDAWYLRAHAPLNGLGGSYVNTCLAARDYAFTGQIDRDGSSFGDITRICEGDISLIVGEWMLGP